MMIAALAAAVFGCGSANAASTFEDSGRLETVTLDKGWTPVNSDIKIPLKGWGKTLQFSSFKPKAVLNEGTRNWRGMITDAGGAAFDIEQTAVEHDGKLVIDIKATSRCSTEIEGIFFWVEVPSEQYAGGSFTVGSGGGAKSGELPKQLPDPYHLASQSADKVNLVDATRSTQVNFEFTPSTWVSLQDGRKWAKNFTMIVHVKSGSLLHGQSASLQIAITTRGKVDDKPAALALDATKIRYKVDGIGGNYCFALNSPVVKYTLDNLKVAASRTEMSLQDWEPQNEDNDPSKSDMAKFAARDVPNSKLRMEFEIMKELSARNIPFTASVWHLPAWTYTEQPPKESGNKIAEDKWPEVLECITSYLLYAKEKYNAEADFFSFNEPDYGVRVQFTPETHRDAIKKIGAALVAAKLKTKMLISDVTNPRGTDIYVKPTAEDPEALKYAGAVSFHSWGGATPQQYGLWADAAEKLKLPLIVAEAGVDPFAWQGGKYNSWDYGAREMEHYQELFLYARPQVVLLWEYSNDYSIVGTNKFDKNKLRPTERFGLQKHFTDFVPPGSEALGTSSDNPHILFTAFRSGKHHTLFLANPKWSRQVTLTGIPPEIKTLNVVRTARGEVFKKLESVNVVDGKISLELPIQSLTTFTTMDVSEIKEP
jgi:O-glycosyl hydrolase